MVVTIGDELWGSRTSDRWKRWAKVLRGAEDVNLAAEGGRALRGEFIDWGRSVALGEGNWLVLAAETGTTAHHSYEYALCRVLDEKVAWYPLAARTAWYEEHEIERSDEERSRSQNSTLYAFACFIAYAERAEAQPAVEPVAETPAIGVPGSAVDLSRVPSEALIAELQRRGVSIPQG